MTAALNARIAIAQGDRSVIVEGNGTTTALMKLALALWHETAPARPALSQGTSWRSFNGDVAGA